MSSLILNSKRSTGKATLIDYNICRIIVPAALFGTLLGVLLNRHAPDWLLLTILVSVLVFMTRMTWKQTTEQAAKEERLEAGGDAERAEAVVRSSGGGGPVAG